MLDVTFDIFTDLSDVEQGTFELGQAGDSCHLVLLQDQTGHRSADQRGEREKNSQQVSHVDKIFGETYYLVRNIRLAFHCMDKDMVKKLISTVIRPRLEYAGMVWFPHKKKHVWKLERLQRMATKIVPELRWIRD